MFHQFASLHTIFLTPCSRPPILLGEQLATRGTHAGRLPLVSRASGLGVARKREDQALVLVRSAVSLAIVVQQPESHV